MAGYGDGRKSLARPGISGADHDLDQKVYEAQVKTLENERRIQELEKALQDRGAVDPLKKWVGKDVWVRAHSQMAWNGKLLAVDRYTITLQFEVEGSGRTTEAVIFKGAIEAVEKD